MARRELAGRAERSALPDPEGRQVAKPTEVRRYCRQLAKACEFAEPADVERYAEAVAFLNEHPSPAVLDALLEALRDREGGEIQYELVEACEAYPLGDYVAALVRHAGRLRRLAPQWGGLIFKSVLNTSASRKALLAAVAAAKAADRRHCCQWATEIAADSQKYQTVARQLRQLAEKTRS
jgi:hypothetical protein